MDIFTLDSGFRRRDVIDSYISVVWTEKYLDSGTVVLSVPATLANREALKEGTFLSTPTSSEVMMIDTQDVQDNILKVSGLTLDSFLANRLVIPGNSVPFQSYVTGSQLPGVAMCDLVTRHCVAGGFVATGGTFFGGLIGAKQVITNLVIGNIDQSGTPQPFSIKRGPLLDPIKEIGVANGVGWYLRPTNVLPGSYQLTFGTYSGLNRTSDQSVNGIVRFSPGLDSLTDIKELRSGAGYKTVAIAVSPDFDPVTKLSGGTTYAGLAYAPGAYDLDIDFKLRVLCVEVTGITLESCGALFSTYKKLMDAEARNALANNNYTKVVDGEVVPQSEFVYGTHYNLGDIIELQDQYGYIQKARVTEYIRSKDASGSRAYPTVSVLD
jgi:hypothetical protein